jgi:hypothetical protein
VLIVRLLTFASGGVACATLHLRLAVPLFWSVVVGFAVYVAADYIAEHAFFGYIG